MAFSVVQVAVCVLVVILDVNRALMLRNETSGLAGPDLHTGSLVYDFGFYNGADSRSYLTAGMNVIAVEADPTLVAAAKTDAQLLAWMNSGQLKLLNTAIAPAGAGALPTKFYMNKCTQEWNSFYSSIGCRGCAAPHVETPSACNEVSIQASTCAEVLQKYGVPAYFKLDIEGAEWSVVPCLAKAESASLIDRLYLEQHPQAWSIVKVTAQDFEAAKTTLRQKHVDIPNYFTQTF